MATPLWAVSLVADSNRPNSGGAKGAMETRVCLRAPCLVVLRQTLCFQRPLKVWARSRDHKMGKDVMEAINGDCTKLAFLVLSVRQAG